MTCGLTRGAQALCWGGYYNGQASTPTPSLVTGGLIFAGVSVGHFNACGLSADSIAYCWGANPIRVPGQR